MLQNRLERFYQANPKGLKSSATTVPASSPNSPSEEIQVADHSNAEETGEVDYPSYEEQATAA